MKVIKHKKIFFTISGVVVALAIAAVATFLLALGDYEHGGVAKLLFSSGVK